MKRFVLASAFASAVVGLATIAIAPVTYASSFELTPFRLVNLARNGYLADQGIPRFNQLSFAYQHNRISAEDVIRAAIDANRVAADTLEDSSYVNAVDHFLRDLSRPSNER